MAKRRLLSRSRAIRFGQRRERSCPCLRLTAFPTGAGSAALLLSCKVVSTSGGTKTERAITSTRRAFACTDPNPTYWLFLPISPPGQRKYSMFPPEQEKPVCLLTNPPQKYAIYLIILTAHLAMTLCGCAGLRFFLANVPNNNQSPAGRHNDPPGDNFIYFAGFP